MTSTQFALPSDTPTPSTSEEEPTQLLKQLAEQTTFGQTANDAATVSPDGKWLAYTIRQSGVHPVAIYTQREARREDQFIPWGTRLIVTNLRKPGEIIFASNLAAAWLPVWSPDAKKLAFVGVEKDRAHLWIYEVDSRSSRQISNSELAAELNDFPPPAWNATSSKLFILSPQPESGITHAPMSRNESDSSGAFQRLESASVNVFGSGEEASDFLKEGKRKDPHTSEFCPFYPPARLMEVDVNDGLAKEIRTPTGYDSSYGVISPSGEWVAFISAPCIHDTQGESQEIALITGNLVIMSLYNGDVLFSQPDIDYPSQLPSSVPIWIDDTRIMYARRGELFLASRSGPTFTKRSLIAEPLHAEQIAISHMESAVFVMGRPPAAWDSSTPSEPIAMWIPLRSRFPPRRLALPVGFRPRAAIASRGHLLWQPAPHSIILIGSSAVTDGGPPETLLLKIDAITGKSKVVSLGETQIEAIDTVEGLSSMVAIRQSPNNPPDLWEFSRSLQPVRPLTRLNPDITLSAVGRIRQFTTQVPSWDGGTVSAVASVILPNNSPEHAHLPAVVTVYPNDQKYLRAIEFSSSAEAGVPTAVLLRSGYAVVYADLPTRPLNSIGNRAQEATDAILPQLVNAAQYGDIDLSRLALFGWSQGGYTAAAVISKTNFFRAAIAGGAAAYDLPGAYGYIEPGNSSPDRWGEEGLNTGGPPWEHLQRYIDNSPYYQVNKVETPLLLLIGDRDVHSYVIEQLKLFAALQTYHKTAQLRIYHGEGHGLFEGTSVNRVDVSLRMLEFLRKYVSRAPL